MTNKQISKQMLNKQIGKKQKTKDIHERIYRFVNTVLNFVRDLPKNQENLVCSGQLIKAVTSMGANDQEADAAESKRDFLAKYAIVKKENKEANYWLRLIGDRNPHFKQRAIVLRKEGQEILFIISKIILNTKRGKAKKGKQSS